MTDVLGISREELLLLGIDPDDPQRTVLLLSKLTDKPIEEFTLSGEVNEIRPCPTCGAQANHIVTEAGVELWEHLP